MYRKTSRLLEYDYTQAGAYFVTVCVKVRQCLLGEVVGEEVKLMQEGEIVQAVWEALPEHYENLKLDEFVVMPNHVHGIVWILEKENPHVGTQHAAPLQTSYRGPYPGSLSAIVRSFKSAATKQINLLRGTTGSPFWQRSFYDHVIRDDEDLYNHRKYIQENPLKWQLDEFYKEQVHG